MIKLTFIQFGKIGVLGKSEMNDHSKKHHSIEVGPNYQMLVLKNFITEVHALHASNIENLINTKFCPYFGEVMFVCVCIYVCLTSMAKLQKKQNEI